MPFKRIIVSLAFSLLFVACAFPQATNKGMADSLLRAISKLQVSDDQFYGAGMFPSQRWHPYTQQYKEDNNIFFTALIVFTLQYLHKDLSPKARILADSISQEALKNYQNYRSRDSIPIYNFWPTQAQKHFPNARLLPHLKHFALPDDIDDTGIVYLSDKSQETNKLWLKKKLIEHSNGYQKHIRNMFAAYQNMPVYSTWFGQNMRIDFDVCALSNLMYWILREKLPLNQHDSATLNFIYKVVANDQHLTHPYLIAPHYGNPAVIIYTVSRLTVKYPHSLLADINQLLHEDIEKLWQNEQISSMERLLLTISMLRLGGSPRPFRIPTHEDFENFAFFVANMISPYEIFFCCPLIDKSLFHLNYRCQAYYLCLLLEYYILQQQYAGQ